MTSIVVGSYAGDYGVHLTRSRRNTTTSAVVEDSLRNRIQSLVNELGLELPVHLDSNLLRLDTMTYGVVLNGRKYAQGSHVEYVVPSQNPSGNSTPTYHIGTILCFYVIYNVDRPKRNIVFVSVKERPVKRKISSMYVLDLLEATPPSSPDDVLLHVDSVSCRVHVVPHMDVSNKSEVVAIRVWDSR